MCWTSLCTNKDTTQYVLDTTMYKQRHNTICGGHHYVQTNTTNVNKSCDLPTNNWR